MKISDLLFIYTPKVLAKAFALFPTLTAIFLILSGYSLLRLAYLLVTLVILGVYLAIDAWGTEQLKKYYGEVTYSGTWILAWSKKYTLVIAVIQTFLFFLSAIVLLYHLDSSYAVILLAYGVVGYIFTLVWGILHRNIPVFKTAFDMVQEWKK